MDQANAGIATPVDLVEYFFDDDPGYGLATSIDLTNAGSIDEMVSMVSDTLASGFHNLFIRIKDEGGRWSIPISKLLYVDLAGQVVSNIEELEYFFDDDPGYGQGLSIPISPSELNPVRKIILNATALPAGNHVLGVRARNELNVWGITSHEPFISFPPSRELDSVSLILFYNKTSGSNWNQNTNWVSGSLDTWYGVTMKNNRVDSIKLSGNKLDGILPPPLAYVDEVTYLGLADNILKDTIPSTFEDLNKLITLELNANQFNEIPDLSGIGSLQTLALDSNYFDFGDLEPLVSIPNLSYSNQRVFKDFPIDSLVSIGQTITLDKLIEGINNEYQWYQNTQPQAFADIEDYDILSFDSRDTGTYVLRINNTLISDLQLETAPYHLRISDFEEDSLAMVSLYQSLGGAGWSNQTNWLTSSLSSWSGVQVNNRRVTGVNLSSRNLKGKIPEDFAYADSLQQIVFANNQITDTIPESFIRFKYLQHMDLSGNQISSIPAFRSLTDLIDLDVSKNRLQFEDLEKNIGVAGFAYALQDSVGIAADTVVDVNTSLAIARSITGANNNYQWLLNGSPIANEMGDLIQVDNIQFENEGNYVLKVTNNLVPDLAMYTRAFGLGVSSLKRDSLALLALYNETGGDQWTTAVNWKTAKITSPWTGVDLGSSRVTGLRLSGFNLTDTIPKKIREITSLENVDFSNNDLRSIPNLTGMSKLTSLNISGNSIGFAELEANRSIGSFTYSPMDNFSIDKQVKIEVGGAYDMHIDVSGKNNSYQWYMNDQPISGATKPTYQIQSIEYDSMGYYRAEVTSSIITDLTIHSGRTEALAVADISGTIFKNTSPYNIGYTTLYKIIAGPYDSIAFSTMDAQGKFIFKNQVLGDYVLKTFPEIGLFATYYRSTILYTEAEAIQLRDQTENQYNITLSGTITPPGEEEKVIGILELDIPDGNRIGSRRKIKKAACAMRRFKVQGRDEQDVFDRELYVETDDEGIFRFYDMEEGTWRLDIDYPGVPIDENSFIIMEIKEGETLELLAVITDDGIEVEQTNTLYFHVPYLKHVNLFPNPSANMTTISYLVNRKIEGMDLQFWSVEGKLLSTQKMPHKRGVHKLDLDISNLDSGVYFLLLSSSNDEVVVQRKLIIP